MAVPCDVCGGPIHRDETDRYVIGVDEFYHSDCLTVRGAE